MNTITLPRRASRLSLLLGTLVLIWVIVAALLFWWIGGENVAANRVLQPDEAAPAWSLATNDGRQFKSADYARRAVVLAFVPVLDSDSARELDSLQKAQSRFEKLGVKTFAVTRDTQEAADALRAKSKLTFPLLMDRDNRVAKSFGAADANGGMRRISYVLANDKVLLPVTQVSPDRHGDQLYELTECCLEDKPQPKNPFIGKPVAGFTLKNVRTGIKESLYADGRQTATVIFILSARCPCSARYDTRFVEIAKTYATQGVRFIGVNANQDEPPSEVAAHAKAKNYPFAVVRDTGATVSKAIRAEMTPEVFVMDRGGILRYHGRIDDSRDIAEVKQNDLRNALDFLIAGKNPPRAEQSAFGCSIVR